MSDRKYIATSSRESPSKESDRGGVPSVDLATLLRWMAMDYWQRGWRPLPVHLSFDEDGTKIPDFGGFQWRKLRERAFSLEETQELFDRMPDANALGIVLEPGHLVIDTDSPEAAENVAGCRLPDGPRAKTLREGGWHYHFRASEDLAEETFKAGNGLEFRCQKFVVFMPPSPGYSWEALPEGDLPELPPALAMMYRLALGGGKIGGEKARKAKAPPKQRDSTPITSEELKPWAELLGDMRPDGEGRWKAMCPLHVETRPSFSVFRGRSGRLQGHCFGCDWSGSLRQLRRDLRKGDTSLYRAAADAVVSLGDEINAQVRAALLLLVAELQKRRLDPLDSFGMSMRDFAKITNCEPLVDKGQVSWGEPQLSLAHGGKAVYRLFEKLRAVGFQIDMGAPGQRHAPTQIRLPTAWFAARSLPRVSRREEQSLSSTLPRPTA